jgi:hypothetical protein
MARPTDDPLSAPEARHTCPYVSAKAEGDGEAIRATARELIRASDADSLARAELALRECASLHDPTGETHHLLGLAQFLQQKYGLAKENLQIALKANPHNGDWQAILQRSTRNDISKIGEGIEPTDPFDNALIARPAAMYLREPVDIKPLPPAPSGLPALYRAVQDIGGAIAGRVLRLILRYESRHGIPSTWTECFALPDGHLRRDLKLGGIRNWMNDHTLQSAYPVGELVANQPPGQKRPRWTTRFRTANGMWTTDDPAEGATGTRFQWQGMTPMSEIRRNRADDGTLPSVREVSRAFLQCEGERVKAPFLNPLTIWWIQFQLHGWLNHRQFPMSPTDCYTVPLAADDPFRARYGLDALKFRKTQPDLTNGAGTEVYQNEVCAWWDGSQIYGSDQQTQDLLRTDPRHPAAFLPDGKLYLDDGLLPLDARGREVSGFTRNWGVGLSVLHTLFVREHNYISGVLRKAHPDWSTDQIFHTARLINAAVLAKIHTVEWTPAVLPTRMIAVGMNTNWNGLIDAMIKRFKDRKAINAFDLTNPVLGGLVGGKRSHHGVPYDFTEQFTEVYRLHPGISDNLEYRPVGSDEAIEGIPIDQLREQGARALIRKVGLANVINSLGHGYMPALVNNNMPAFMSDMSAEGLPVTDLGTADILRARERGVPQYNEFRRQLGMAEIARFEDLRCDEKTLAKLNQVYGEGRDGVEKMDLAVGMLCDRDLPLAGFDNVRFAIFLQMASRRLEADPFYCEKFNARYYTQEGIDHIDRVNLKDLLLRHCPELAGSGLPGVNNAFEPWNTTAAEAPDEHPLTTFAERY